VPHLAPLHGHKVDRQHHIVLATNPHLDLGFMVNGLGFFLLLEVLATHPHLGFTRIKTAGVPHILLHLEVTRIETTAT
jgi:hypothetical protein